MATTPSVKKQSEEAESPATAAASEKAAGPGTELRSIEDVRSICRDTRTLSREDYPARIATMRRVRTFLDAHPLDPGDAKALSEDLRALRYTPARRSTAPGSDDEDPLEQLLTSRRERDQAWDELMQSLHGKSR